MNLSGLSLDNIPPLKTPLFFFLLAPLFGVLAGALAVWQPELLTNRWQTATLAFTHLLTLGFGAMIMLGALFQVLPVVSNRSIALNSTLAATVRWTLAGGVLLLAYAFLSQHRFAYLPAVLLLAVSFGVFISGFMVGLVKARPAGDTTFTLRLAAVALLTTLMLGGLQLSLRFWPEADLYLYSHTQLHTLWGGFGWALLLIMAVSYQVIPMFHVAPPFPRRVCVGLGPAVLCALIGLSLAPASGMLKDALLTLLALLAGAYALVALNVLNGRKRKLVDYTVKFWQLGLSQLLLAVLLMMWLTHTDPISQRAELELLLALAVGVGFALSIMLGMLQKIVPFLIYLHLQKKVMASPATMMIKLPHMKALITTERSRVQYRLQLTSLAVLYSSLWFNGLVAVAGLALIANFAWLWRSLWGAWLQYRGVERQAAELIGAAQN